jgi:DNA repair/transcription protein MET18/MMS19
MLNIVKALGEFLTSEDDELRKKGKVEELLSFFFLSSCLRPRCRFSFVGARTLSCGETESTVWCDLLSEIVNYKLMVVSLEARVLTTFYCDKLDDTETIIPALKGLVSLTALPSFTSIDALTVIHA